MTSYGNSFEGGTNGATIVAATSGGASGDPYTNVVIGGLGDSVNYSNAHAAHGSLSAQFTTALLGGPVYVEKVFPGLVATMGGRLYCYFTAFPPSTIRLVTLTDASGNNRCRITLNANGKLAFLNATGGVAGGTFSTAIPLNAWFRIEYDVVLAAGTGGSGTLSRFDSMESTTPTESSNPTGVTFGGTADRVRLGVTVSVANVGPLWIDDTRLNDTGGFPGPLIVTTSAAGAEHEVGSTTVTGPLSATAGGAESEVGTATFAGPAIATASGGVEQEVGATTVTSPATATASGVEAEVGTVTTVVPPTATATGAETELGTATATGPQTASALGGETETGQVSFAPPLTTTAAGAESEVGTVSTAPQPSAIAGGGESEVGVAGVSTQPAVTAAGHESEVGTAAGLLPLLATAAGHESESGTAGVGAYPGTEWDCTRPVAPIPLAATLVTGTTQTVAGIQTLGADADGNPTFEQYDDLTGTWTARPVPTVEEQTTPDAASGHHTGILVGAVLPVLVPSPFGGFGNALQFDGVNRGSSSQGVDCGTDYGLTIAPPLPARQLLTDDERFFEGGTGRWVNGGGALFVGQDPTAPHTGTYDLQVNSNTATTDSFACILGSGPTPETFTSLDLKPGRTYQVTGWTQAASGSAGQTPESRWPCTIYLDGDNGLKGTTATWDAATPPPAGTYGAWTLNFTVAPGDSMFDIRLYNGLNLNNDEAMYFDDLSFMELAGSNSLGADAQFCLEAKCQVAEIVGNQMFIAGRAKSTLATGALQPYIAIDSVSGKFFTALHDDTGTLRQILGTTLAELDGKYRVMSDYDGENLRLLINGVVEGELPLTGVEPPDNFTRFMIGRDDEDGNNAGTSVFNGVIDEVRLSDISRYVPA